MLKALNTKQITAMHASAIEGRRIIFQRPDGAFPLSLYSAGRTYTVIYGAQIFPRLTYAEAAAELGRCLMHVWQCEGKLDV